MLDNVNPTLKEKATECWHEQQNQLSPTLEPVTAHMNSCNKYWLNAHDAQVMF